MKNSNENKYRNKLRASRTVNIVLSVLLILSVCIAPIFAAASNRFDVTGDGLVDTRDIVRMMKYIAGAIDEDGNPITPGIMMTAATSRPSRPHTIPYPLTAYPCIRTTDG